MQQSIMLGVKACLKAARKGTHCTGKACKTPVGMGIQFHPLEHWLKCQ